MAKLIDILLVERPALLGWSYTVDEDYGLARIVTDPEAEPQVILLDKIQLDALRRLRGGFQMGKDGQAYFVEVPGPTPEEELRGALAAKAAELIARGESPAVVTAAIQTIAATELPKPDLEVRR